MNKLPVTFFAVFFASLAVANEVAIAPTVSPDGLPPLGNIWLTENPYRGNPVAIATGLQAYNQACARCHGAEASINTAPAPDLRRLNRFCKRIADAELNAACMRDNDAYFAKTVRNGKIIVGVTHMPPWEGVLKQELAWAIQAFIESRASGRRE
ncbi:MAG: c-type cytochrome [Rhodocyclaceae bacterium]|nr:c-type cytochrome [Rhodocyclaceae bacterium]